MLCNFSVCSILLCGDFSVGWISCSNRAVTLLLWKGTVARLKRSDLYPTGLFFCSCIFFQSSHCSSSESTKPHTLDANTKVTCSWLCFLSKIIIENITGWPTVTDWKSHFCPQVYLQILFIMVGLKRYQCAFLIDLGKAVNKTRIPQQWRELSMRAAYHWWQDCHARKPLGRQGRKGQAPDLEVPSMTSEERSMNCRLEKIPVSLSGAISCPCEWRLCSWLCFIPEPL